MENGEFAPNEQMFHFPHFQIHDISKVSKGVHYDGLIVRHKYLL